jgi:hypothetical protein
MFHYHLNREFPFSIGCFRGSVDYYAALGSTDMRETLLPIYSRSYAANKVLNARAEVAGAVGLGLDGSGANGTAPPLPGKAGALAGLLTRAAAEVEGLAAAASGWGERVV